MAKLSGLISQGKLGEASAKTLNAMPSLPTTLESSIPLVPNKEKQGKPPSPDNRQITELELTQIVSSPYQVRVASGEESIEALVTSISTEGVISPIVVRMLDSSMYEIVAGHNRLEACRRLGYKTVPVVVCALSDAEAARALTSDNFVRRDLSDYERFKHAKLLKEKGFCKTNSEIGQVLGVSRQLVGFLFAFGDFPESAIRILDSSPAILGATQANELRNLAKTSPEVFTEALKLLSEKRLQQNRMRRWIENHSGMGKAAVVVPRQEIKIEKPGLRSSIKMVFTENEVKIQAENLDIDRLKQLIETNLKHLLKE